MAFKGPLLKDLRGAKKQQRISQLAANPTTRKAIPDDLLPLVYRKAREQAVYGKQPAAPGSPLTNADVARQANAATQLQYGAQDRLLQRRQEQTPDYYDAYLAELRKAQAGAVTQGQQTGQAIQQLYGSGPMAPGSNQATLGAAQGGTATLLGQVQANYDQALQAAVASGKLKALANVGLERSDLEQTKGAFNVEQRAKIKQQAGQDAATAALANVKTDTAQSAQTQKGLDFLAKTGHTPAFAASHPGQFAKDVAASKKKPAHGRSQEEIDRPYLTKYGLTYNQFKSAAAKGQRPKPLSAKKGKGGSGAPGAKDGTFLAPAGQQAVVQRVHKLAQYLNGTQRWEEGPRKGKVMTWSEKVNHLTGKLLEPQNVVDAAASLAQNARKGRKNTLGPSGASALHSAGAQVHGHFKYTGGKKKQ